MTQILYSGQWSVNISKECVTNVNNIFSSLDMSTNDKIETTFGKVAQNWQAKCQTAKHCVTWKTRGSSANLPICLLCDVPRNAFEKEDKNVHLKDGEKTFWCHFGTLAHTAPKNVTNVL